MPMQVKQYNEFQYEMANHAYTYLMTHMDRHITIEALAGILSISETSLKRYFSAVYGESIYAFLRKQKMHSAANMLKETEYSVLYIAGAYGYANASKFSAAFYKVMHMTPSEYRKNNR